MQPEPSLLMAKQTRKWNPGDAANVFVRVILSDAGTRLGGLTEAEWHQTLEWFDGRCAYTGDVLDDLMDRDHAIPMNRSHCGLHLYGNVLPSTQEANRQKADKHYRDFVEVPDRLGRIESFIRESGYWEKVSVFGDLQRYCEAQYRSIDALCRVNRQYLDSLLPENLDGGRGSGPEPDSLATVRREGETLPITLEPPAVKAFKDALLRKGEARILEIHRDGQTIERRWNASNMSESSNVLGNLRSRPRYRSGAWKPLGIQSLTVSVTNRGREPSGVAPDSPTKGVPGPRHPGSDGSGSAG